MNCDRSDEVVFTAPASDQQRYWWAVERLYPSADRVIPTCLRVRGRLNPGALGAACDVVARRHEALRTNFVRDGQELGQVIRGAPSEDWTWHRDLTTLSPPEVEPTIAAILREERTRPCDLAAGSLTRLGTLRLADDDWLLVLTLHHIIADGWSVRVLLRELFDAYSYLARGEDVPVPSGRTPQLREWVDEERRYLAGSRAVRDAAYWRDVLEHLRPVRLPPDVASSTEARTAARPFRIPSSLRVGVRAACTAHRVTANMVVLAALLRAIGGRTGRDDVAVRTIVSRRGRPEVENLIGCITNELPIAVDLPAAESVDVLLRRVRSAVSSAHDHQDLPGPRIWRELGSSAKPIDILFVYEVLASSARDAVDGLVVEPYVSDTPAFRDEGNVRYGIELRVTDDGEELTGEVKYDARAYAESTVDTLWTSFLDNLKYIVTRAEGRAENGHGDRRPRLPSRGQR